MRRNRLSTLGFVFLFLSTAALKCGGPPAVQPLSAPGPADVGPPGVCSGLAVQPGLQLWLDAAALPVGDGGSVSSWNDCARGGVAAVQGAAASQPVFSATGGPGGGAAVSFDGVNDYMTVSASTLDFSPGLTIFAVASFAPYAGGTDRGFLDKMDTTSMHGFSLQMFPAGYFVPFIDGMGGSGATYASDTWYLTNFIITGSLVTEYQNGATSGLMQGGAWDMSPTDLYLFARKFTTNPGHYMNGKLAELVIYNKPLSADDRFTVQCYLSAKHGLQIPYCN